MSFCNTCARGRVKRTPKPFLKENFEVIPSQINNKINFRDIFNPNKKISRRPTKKKDDSRRWALFIKYYYKNQDVEDIIGKECFEEFMQGHNLEDPGLTFYQTIKGHLTGDARRTPFPEEIEVKLLKRMRQKQRWPAYEGTKYKNGSRGLCKNVFGFHEKQRALKNISF